MMSVDPAAVDDGVNHKDQSSSSYRRRRRSSRKSASDDEESHSKTTDDDPFVVIHAQLRSPTSVMAAGGIGRSSTPSKRRGHQLGLQAFHSSFTALPVSDSGGDSSSSSRFNNSFASTFDSSFSKPKSPVPRIVLEGIKKKAIARNSNSLATLLSSQPKRKSSNNSIKSQMRAPRHASPPKRNHSAPLSPCAAGKSTLGTSLPNIPDLNRSFLHTVDTDKLKKNKKKKDRDYDNEGDNNMGDYGFGVHNNQLHGDNDHDDDDWVGEEGSIALLGLDDTIHNDDNSINLLATGDDDDDVSLSTDDLLNAFNRSAPCIMFGAALREAQGLNNSWVAPSSNFHDSDNDIHENRRLVKPQAKSKSRQGNSSENKHREPEADFDGNNSFSLDEIMMLPSSSDEDKSVDNNLKVLKIPKRHQSLSAIIVGRSRRSRSPSDDNTSYSSSRRSNSNSRRKIRTMDSARGNSSDSAINYKKKKTTSRGNRKKSGKDKTKESISHSCRGPTRTTSLDSSMMRSDSAINSSRRRSSSRSKSSKYDNTSRSCRGPNRTTANLDDPAAKKSTRSRSGGRKASRKKRSSKRDDEDYSRHTQSFHIRDVTKNLILDGDDNEIDDDRNTTTNQSRSNARSCSPGRLSSSSKHCPDCMRRRQSRSSRRPEDSRYLRCRRHRDRSQSSRSSRDRSSSRSRSSRSQKSIDETANDQFPSLADEQQVEQNTERQTVGGGNTSPLLMDQKFCFSSISSHRLNPTRIR